MRALEFITGLPDCEHNDDYECFTCETARHDAAHPSGDVDGCRSCKIKGVRIYGRFTGTASMSDAVQEFHATGDPAVFDRQDRAAALTRNDRLVRVG